MGDEQTIVLGQRPHRLRVYITPGAVTGYTLTFTDPTGGPLLIDGALQIQVEDGPTWTASVLDNVATWTLDAADTAVTWITRRAVLVRVNGTTRDVIAQGWVVADA